MPYPPGYVDVHAINYLPTASTASAYRTVNQTNLEDPSMTLDCAIAQMMAIETRAAVRSMLLPRPSFRSLSCILGRERNPAISQEERSNSFVLLTEQTILGAYLAYGLGQTESSGSSYY